MNRQYALPLTAVLGGAAALVLRLLQNNTGFEADTGLPIPGNLAELALAVLLIALAAGLLGSSCLLPREEEEDSPALPRDFTTTSTALLPLAVWQIWRSAFAFCRRDWAFPGISSTVSCGTAGWASPRGGSC